MVDHPGDLPSRKERAFERIAADAFVRVLGADRDYVFRTRDLSEGGLFLYTRVGHLYPFSVGQEVSIELHDFSEVVVLRGVIARIVEPGTVESEHYPLGFGVRLVAADEAQAEKLRALVTRARAAPLY